MTTKTTQPATDAPTGPRAPRIVEWCDVPDYPGFQARIWVNVTQRTAAEITNGDQERALAALKQVVVEHNGWLDPDGEPYPAADSDDFWESLPVHLLNRVVLAIREAATRSPLPPANGRR